MNREKRQKEQDRPGVKFSSPRVNFSLPSFIFRSLTQELCHQVLLLASATAVFPNVLV